MERKYTAPAVACQPDGPLTLAEPAPNDGDGTGLAAIRNGTPTVLIQGAAGTNKVKVLITETPHVREVDGVKVDDMQPGTIREVSPSVGAWLIAEGYAAPEMRNSNDLAWGHSDRRKRP